MPFFEILMVLERFKEDLERDNERSQAQNSEHQAKIEAMKASMPKMSDMKLPSFNMPKMPTF